MSCWFPSPYAEGWFPQLRINRLAKEAAEASKMKSSESVTAKPRRRTTKPVAESKE